MILHDTIAILDFGSQYTQLIARRLRELGVYSVILPYDIDEKGLNAHRPKAIILSGGPNSVTDAASPRAPEFVFKLAIPVLGICYGMQTMAVQLGGKVLSSSKSEFGHALLELHGHSELFSNIEDITDDQGRAQLDVWMSHGDKVVELPSGFKVIAQSDNAEIAAIVDSERQFYGLQFHPEVTHTKQGMRLLKEFALTICGCQADWTTKNIIEENIALVKKTVGDETVLLGLSGGVDSSVVAALLHQAIGEKLQCVFVDTGLLRLNEGSSVKMMFETHMGLNIIFVDAKARFYNALQGVGDPEAKRKIIGREFINVFKEQAATLKGVNFLAQGTIYPDVIESSKASSQSHVIKSHHNVGGLPEDLGFELVEPLNKLFKDEVRELGLELGLPHEMVFRHPFPGPGLGVRVLGEIKSRYVEILQHADAIFIDALREANLYDKVSQAFAVFLPVKSVGVTGDGRRYEPIIALRAVETVDFMTARWAELPHAFLASVSLQIMNEVSGVSRVVYDISGKPPATIEWE